MPMNETPKAVASFEQEKQTAFKGGSFFFEHPVERLKYHIMQTGGKVTKSELSIDGLAYVAWESDGRQYRAWSSWPDGDYEISWKLLK
ncbi:MAG: hypothetical protein OHK006_02030 [Thermodesulfovibrionales bacterium]